jgi:nucleotide-binding universal stress UspA family protein
MTPMVRRILVPTDFSAPSDAALDLARTFAERFGASLHLLHVIEDPYVNVAEAYIAGAPPTLAAMLQDAQSRLAQRLTQQDRIVLRATSEISFGSSATTIVDRAFECGTDLIVMGTHGRTGLAHLLIGSIAERVVRTAPCPVLTVRGDTAVEEAVQPFEDARAVSPS